MEVWNNKQHVGLAALRFSWGFALHHDCSLSEQNTLGPSFQQKYVETSILKYCWVWVFNFFLLKKYPPHTYSFFEKRNKPRPLCNLLVYKMEFYIRNILLIRTQKLSESHPYFSYKLQHNLHPFSFFQEMLPGHETQTTGSVWVKSEELC